MMCCFPTGIEDHPSEQADRLLNIIRVISIFQFCFAVVTFFVDIWEGLMMLIGGSILLCLTCNKNWCTSVFYIVLAMMDFLACIVLVGNYLAQEGDFNGSTGIIVGILLFKIPFYVIAMYYSFLAYREFKGLFIEKLMSGELNEQLGGFGGGLQHRVVQGEPVGYPPTQPREQPPQYFTGEGHRIG